MTDHALDALLAEYVAPPVPYGLVGRVAAAALALPQEPRPAYARRAGAMTRHDRRGKWLRRPFLLGGVALGLAVSGAVAATLAGLRVDWPTVESVLADLPFLGREMPADPVPPPRAEPPGPPPAAEPAPAEAGRAATRTEEAPSAPRAVEASPDLLLNAAPEPVPRRPDGADARLVETRPAAPLAAPAGDSAREAAPPPATAEREEAPAPVVEPRAPAQGVDESARLRQERIERAERLRAARQAQIERLQRVQQRRERLRPLRRD